MKAGPTEIIVGTDGRLRLIWRAVIFYTAGTYLVWPLLDRVFEAVAKSLHLTPTLSAAYIGLGELRNFFTALLCTGAFALYEHRRIDSYGLSVKRALSRQTFEGAAAGTVVAGVVARWEWSRSAACRL